LLGVTVTACCATAVDPLPKPNESEVGLAVKLADGPAAAETVSEKGNVTVFTPVPLNEIVPL
jgi:hypothetical protein